MSTHRNLATYACQPSASRGRLYREPDSRTRDCFQRDRDRIVHAGAFRRLQYKTQVFVNHEGDFFRTRLTHSLEVAQIARSSCRFLGLNEDLAEALALGHDLGHPPFGHAGEEALDELTAVDGGFDHNAQSLRVVTYLEQVYPTFDGLNLTWETLEGIVKHNGPMAGVLPRYIEAYLARHDLEVDSYPSAEAQVAAIADDIAYDNHDIDDGLRARLFSLSDLKDVPLIGPAIHHVTKTYPDLDEARIIREVVRHLIGQMVSDLLEESARRLGDAAPKSADDVRRFGRPVIAFSDPMAESELALKSFLRQNMYDHYMLNRMTSKSKRLIKDLFQLLETEPDCLPTEWRQRASAPGSTETRQLVTDYLAGMTDRFALDEHKKLFDLQARAS